MSKATEFEISRAEALAKRPIDFVRDVTVSGVRFAATLGDGAVLNLFGGKIPMAVLSTNDAIALAIWIDDTFSETPKIDPKPKVDAP